MSRKSEPYDRLKRTARDIPAARELARQAERRGDHETLLDAEALAGRFEELLTLAARKFSASSWSELTPIAQRLGLGLDAEVAPALREAWHGNQARQRKHTITAQKLLETLYEARVSKQGLAFTYSRGSRAPVCFAIRRDTRIHVLFGRKPRGISGKTTPRHIWPELTPWRSPLSRNVEQVYAWLDGKPSAPQVSVPIVELGDAMKIMATPARNASAREIKLDALLSHPEPGKDEWKAHNTLLKSWPVREGRAEVL